MKSKFNKSNSLFKKVVSIVPTASQTFSKSYLQYIKEVAPLFAVRGRGSHLWDIDGNEYIDLVSGLAAISLGYQYPAIDKAIKNQLKKGIVFSLASSLEYELALLLKKHIPCAEMVRFGKNGSDVTTAAIRLVRAVTGRDHIAVGGYHGWHDWSIGTTTRNLGIPEATRALSHKFTFNDISSLEKIFKEYSKSIAAVILEPATYEAPSPGFLAAVKKITHRYGALLIFDEVASGWKTSLGGAQALYKVTPDLATFGKAMSNGMPISAVVGKAKYMKKMEDIFFSFTAGGECLSLAAAIATIKVMEKEKFPSVIKQKALYLKKNLDRLIKKNNLGDTVIIVGIVPWQSVLVSSSNGFAAIEIKSYIQQELLEKNILWIGNHILNLSHTKKDLDTVINAYGCIFKKLKEFLDKKTLRKNLKGDPITDIFKIR
ncbi:MAG: aminotransferase class III-fold pyridoxal phosphate-dependent enzyme [Candidatus Paceibacterota bacterium]